MIFQYDASQEKCPLPLVKLRLILKEMKKKDVCTLKIKDSASKKNIPKLLSQLGYCFKQTPIDNNVVEITLSKK
jgi:TusA-related sulfurtransferase